MLEALLERFRHRDRLALARLLTLLSRGQQVDEILASLPKPPRPSRVVAVTGSGGVGKSTLVGRSIEWLRRQGRTVAVLACDPQSPLSGGALLGDRFRMPAGADDDGVFIRSLAAAPGQGAVAQHLDAMVRLLQAFGFAIILLETVGAGQGDTAVRDLADVVVLLLQPETGDDLQWEKAGVLEVADVIAVHKADLPRAEQVEAQVRAMLGLADGRPVVPVLRVSARTGEGIEALWAAIDACSLPAAGRSGSGRDLLRLAQGLLARWFAAAQATADPELTRILAAWQQGNLTDRGAASALLQLLQREPERRAAGDPLTPSGPNARTGSA